MIQSARDSSVSIIPRMSSGSNNMGIRSSFQALSGQNRTHRQSADAGSYVPTPRPKSKFCFAPILSGSTACARATRFYIGSRRFRIKQSRSSPDTALLRTERRQISLLVAETTHPFMYITQQRLLLCRKAFSSRGNGFAKQQNDLLVRETILLHSKMISCTANRFSAI